MKKATKGNHFWWVPRTPDALFVQVDLAQLEGPAHGSCGLVWGSRGPGDYLGVSIGARGHIRIHRREGGATGTTLSELGGTATINPPPRSNRIRIESWDDRHRVFVNGVCVEDFYEPGYRGGKVGLLATLRQEGTPAVFAADNLIVGALEPAAAGIATQTVTGTRVMEPGLVDNRPRKKPRARRTSPAVSIEKVWVRSETRRNVEGITVRVAFRADNLKGRPLRAIATFADARTGAPVRDADGRHRARDASVAATHDFSPRYRVSTFGDFPIFIPLGQLHQHPKSAALKCRVGLWDQSRDPPVCLGVSEWVRFKPGR